MIINNNHHLNNMEKLNQLYMSDVNIRFSIVGETDNDLDKIEYTMFVKKRNRIRIAPLSMIAAKYHSISSCKMVNFSEKSCVKQNNNIFGMSEINSVQSIIDKNIDPFFYEWFYPRDDFFIDKNSFFKSQYSLILNVDDYEQDIRNAHIIIYVNSESNLDSDKFKKIVDIANSSSNICIVLPILSIKNRKESSTNNKNFINELNSSSENKYIIHDCIYKNMKKTRDLRSSIIDKVKEIMNEYLETFIENDYNNVVDNAINIVESLEIETRDKDYKTIRNFLYALIDWRNIALKINDNIRDFEKMETLFKTFIKKYEYNIHIYCDIVPRLTYFAHVKDELYEKLNILIKDSIYNAIFIFINKDIDTSDLDSDEFDLEYLYEYVNMVNIIKDNFPEECLSKIMDIHTVILKKYMDEKEFWTRNEATKFFRIYDNINTEEIHFFSIKIKDMYDIDEVILYEGRIYAMYLLSMNNYLKQWNDTSDDLVREMLEKTIKIKYGIDHVIMRKKIDNNLFIETAAGISEMCSQILAKIGVNTFALNLFEKTNAFNNKNKNEIQYISETVPFESSHYFIKHDNESDDNSDNNSNDSSESSGFVAEEQSDDKSSESSTSSDSSESTEITSTDSTTSSISTSTTSSDSSTSDDSDY